jgi:hypothetical protein
MAGIQTQDIKMVGWLGLEPRTNPESLRGCSTDCFDGALASAKQVEDSSSF